MLLYYITDRRQFPCDEPRRKRSLLSNIAEAARLGVDFIQLRERDLTARQLEDLANDAAQAVRQSSTPTRLLINSRSDVALACAAHGVHLPSNDIASADARAIWKTAMPLGAPCLVGVSCHSLHEVELAAAGGADYVLFGPVFEKKDHREVPPSGLEGLRRACRVKIPVLALGGITTTNARACLDAGAAGIAAIRLFQQDSLAEIISALGR